MVQAERADQYRPLDDDKPKKKLSVIQGGRTEDDNIAEAADVINEIASDLANYKNEVVPDSATYQSSLPEGFMSKPAKKTATTQAEYVGNRAYDPEIDEEYTQKLADYGQMVEGDNLIAGMLEAKRQSLKEAMLADDRELIETIKDEIAELENKPRQRVVEPKVEMQKSKTFQLRDLRTQEGSLLNQIENLQNLLTAKKGDENTAADVARLTDQLNEVRAKMTTMLGQRQNTQERYAAGQQANTDQQKNRQGNVYQQMDYAKTQKKGLFSRIKSWFSR